MEEKFITIGCICGNSYDSSVGKTPKIMGSHPDYRFHKCPYCGRIWDLRPDLNKDKDAE